MKTKTNSIFNQIHFRTEVLESLGWDESQLEALFLYLEKALNTDTKYSEITLHIKENFGDQCLKIITSIFNEEAFLFSFRSKE